ncbi:hypothetical protein BX666DRAFT_818989 [Dichotomocladium elegans]|nr:hypothetical protein BX666DRAFT_818989 [Dichotomocladium elegans]
MVETRRLTPNNNFNNPKFTGYKLEPYTNGPERVPLPGGKLQIHKIGHNHRLGFRELQARIRYSHLALGFPVSPTMGKAYYIDDSYIMVQVIYNAETKTTDVSPVVTLTQPLGGIPNYAEPDSTVPTDPYFPSVRALDPQFVVAANGAGDFEIVDTLAGAIVGAARYEGDGTEGVSPVPCVLMAARRHGDIVRMVVYSRAATKETQFNIATLEFDLQTGLLATRHIQRGHEVPVYCQIAADGRVVFGSEQRLEDARKEKASGNGESMDVAMAPPATEAQQTTTTTTTSEPAPYQWTQEDRGDLLTLQFALPPGTPKAAISCRFTPTHLSLLVQGDLVSYPFRKLWTTVRADECTWTIDSATGVLSVFLTKQDDRTRWPHVFDQDDGVLETLEPGKLEAITDSLARLTESHASIQAMQHPVAQDIDEAIDEEGQAVEFGVYDLDGRLVQEILSGGREWVCGSFESLNSEGISDNAALASVCVKTDVDGQVYRFVDKGGVLDPEHAGTFDAFAFVQASKRDGRFVLHDPGLGFVAVVESNRNAYIYYRHGDKREVERQTLVDLTEGHDVDVVGCQLILSRTLMVLTETELVIIHL